MRIYLGVLQSTHSGVVGAMPSHEEVVATGGVSGSSRDRANAKVGASRGYFAGKLGEFAAWNQARAAAQVQADSQGDCKVKRGRADSALRGARGQRRDPNDSTFSGLHATINGASWAIVP